MERYSDVVESKEHKAVMRKLHRHLLKDGPDLTVEDNAILQAHLDDCDKSLLPRDKAMAVIASCQTDEHLWGARRYVHLLNRATGYRWHDQLAGCMIMQMMKVGGEFKQRT